MTQFTIVCPACSSELTLSTRRLLLRLDTGTATSGEVLFSCLSCKVASAAPVSVQDAAVLVAAGVTFVSLSEPVVEHPEAPPAGPALTPDDLLDLHTALRDDSWFAQLSAAGC